MTKVVIYLRRTEVIEIFWMRIQKQMFCGFIILISGKGKIRNVSNPCAQIMNVSSTLRNPNMGLSQRDSNATISI